MQKAGLETRELILQAALEAFASRGFKGATVREICAAAGQSVGSVNYHFRDKDGLYEAVTSKLMEEIILRHEPEPPDADRLSAREKLRIFIRTYLARFGSIFSGKNNGIRGMFLMREIMDPSECFRRMFSQLQSRQKDYLLKIISELTGQPVSKPEVMLSGISVIGQCFHFIFGRRIFGLLGFETGRLTDIEQCVSHIEEFSLGGIMAVTGERK